MGIDAGNDLDWVDAYVGVGDGLADLGVLPLQGIRMLVGINGDGENVFYVKMDGAEDNVMAVFLLDFAADVIREQARKAYAMARRHGVAG